MRFSTRFALSMAASLARLAAPPLVQTATAGCGCDHPPPAFAPVMPPFASPGKTITLNAAGFTFKPGQPYAVEFGGQMAYATAERARELKVVVPSNVMPGPMGLRVMGFTLDYEYSENDFTAMPGALPMPTADGLYVLFGYPAAVSADGTILIPFDVTNVLDPTQFAFVLGSLRLSFGHEDVVFWNRDGVDLTLFTLNVEDSTQRQWGSYYGWNVDQDDGIEGDVYEEQTMDSMDLFAFSDLLTYWRHEFFTYRDAHAPGGTHEVNAAGYHLNTGTLHIDHNNLVLAINGEERDEEDPTDPSENDPLGPGMAIIDLFVGTKISENPIEPSEIEALIQAAIQSGAVTVANVPSSSGSGSGTPDPSDPGGALDPAMQTVLQAYVAALAAAQ